MTQNLFLDFETYYDTKFSLTKMTTMEYVRDPRFKVWGVGARFSEEDETTWYGEDEVEDFIESVDWSDTIVICHNALFDAYILTQYYGVRPAGYGDTAAMARGCWPGESAKLADVAERVFPDDQNMRKGDELINAKGIVDLPPDIEEQIAGYCKQDVDLTAAIYEELMHDYPGTELKLIDITTRMFVEPGLVLDRELLTTYRDQEINKAQTAIRLSGVDPKVLSSNQQFENYLETELNIVAPTKVSNTTGKDIPAFGKNDAAFKQLQEMYPQYQAIWDARIAIKSRISETRAQRFLDAANNDGTLSVPLRYYAAHTGRFGGTEKINMQNLPRGSEIRRALCAPEGMLVYVADLSNIEARMLAWLAGEDDLLEQFANGEDVYSNFASEIYKKPIDKHNNPTERFVGKTAILGLGYGMGHEKFAYTMKSGAMGPALDFSIEEANNVVNTYRNTYERVPALWNTCNNFLLDMLTDKNNRSYGPLYISKERIWLPNGMSLYYKDLDVENKRDYVYTTRGMKQKTYGGRITENIIQALSRIVITDGILRIEQYLQSIGGKIVLTVHDEIVSIAPEANPCNIMDEIIRLMCIPPAWAPNLPLAAEGGYDKVYSK